MLNKVLRISAFSDGQIGGNPAGVYIAEAHPTVASMRSIAAEVGYSETAFAERTSIGWRVRYFSPETEVPFCGHATIALGAALTQQNGAGVFSLALNETEISVEGWANGELYSAALQSPETQSRELDASEVSEVLRLFGYTENDLDPKIPPAFANGGANHLIIGLNSRKALSNMKYDLSEGRIFMNDLKLITVMFVYAESNKKFHSRNPFASGGVYEDPATGAASAAFAGYLRDIGWQHGGMIDLVQGEDMGARSLIRAELTDDVGSSIRVSGSARFM